MTPRWNHLNADFQLLSPVWVLQDKESNRSTENKISAENESILALPADVLDFWTFSQSVVVISNLIVAAGSLVSLEQANMIAAWKGVSS